MLVSPNMLPPTQPLVRRSTTIGIAAWILACIIACASSTQVRAGSTFELVDSQVSNSITETPPAVFVSTRGRWLAIDFFATWCEACMRDFPREVANFRNASARTSFLGIDERESAFVIQRLVRAKEIPFAVILDNVNAKLVNRGTIADRRAYLLYGAPGAFGSLAQFFDVSYLPTHLLLNPNGCVVARWSSSPPDRDILRAKLTKYRLLRGLTSHLDDRLACERNL